MVSYKIINYLTKLKIRVKLHVVNPWSSLLIIQPFLCHATGSHGSGSGFRRAIYVRTGPDPGPAQFF